MIYFLNYKKVILKIFILIVLFSSAALYAQTVYKNNILEIPEVDSSPVIDAKTNDECWRNMDWQEINEVWIPYGGSVESKDFSGKYKVAWSSEENLLYFLVEIIDDVFVDGFVQGETADTYNFDILEVFIDEDKSGGLHVFDGAGDIGRDWGTNAENAFAYHVYAKFPEEGEVTKNFIALDIAGQDWASRQDPDYAVNFSEFALRKDGNQLTYEFSLKVYDDTYDKDGNIDIARVQLKTDKEMGLSLAYCDNDSLAEEPKTRDNFFGSVWVKDESHNDHWKNAGDFRTVKLLAKPNTIIRNDGRLLFLREDGSTIASVNIEIAQTPRSRVKGLMGRELADFSIGMLFLYQNVKVRSFWMRNTPGSLDIIFVGEDLRIINIAEKTMPMSDKRYISKSPAKYVVEVKGGFTKRYGIDKGTKIYWERL